MTLLGWGCGRLCGEQPITRLCAIAWSRPVRLARERERKRGLIRGRQLMRSYAPNDERVGIFPRYSAAFSRNYLRNLGRTSTRVLARRAIIPLTRNAGDLFVITSAKAYKIWRYSLKYFYYSPLCCDKYFANERRSYLK
jgi:hypothetical protein